MPKIRRVHFQPHSRLGCVVVFPSADNTQVLRRLLQHSYHMPWKGLREMHASQPPESSTRTAWSSKPEDAEHACNAASNATPRNQSARSVPRPTGHASGTQMSRLACGSKMSPLSPKEKPGDLETRKLNRPTPRLQSSKCQSQHFNRPSRFHWTTKPFITGYNSTSLMPRVCTKPLMSGTHTCFLTG
jgi:hypothetical protein